MHIIESIAVSRSVYATRICVFSAKKVAAKRVCGDLFMFVASIIKGVIVRNRNNVSVCHYDDLNLNRFIILLHFP